MKNDWKKALLTGFIVYLVLTPFRDLIDLMVYDNVTWKFTTLHYYSLSITSCISFLLYTVVSYLILYHVSKDENFKKAITIIVILSPVISLVRYLIQEIGLDILFGFTNYHPDYGLIPYLVDNLYYAVIFNSIGIAYFYIQFSRYTMNQKNELVIQNRQTELALLRNQMNPHFLFNVLNSIYSLVNKGSDKSKQAITTLSSILRYSLYDTDANVKISEEWTYLDDYLELQQFRFKEPIQIEMKLEASLKDRQIPPFILIPFLENIIKHGVITEPAKKATFYLENDDNNIVLRTSNFISKSEKDKTGGIGLSNIKKRLDLIYGEHYSLEITQESDEFQIIMRIPK